MKIEFDLDDSVYEFMSAYLLDDYGLTLGEFLARYLTHMVATAVTNPEMGTAFLEKIKEVPGGEAFGARLLRKPSDDRS